MSANYQVQQLTVPNQEPGKEGAQVIRVEPAPSTNSEPLDTDPEALPPVRRRSEEVFFCGSVVRTLLERVGAVDEVTDERDVVLDVARRRAGCRRHRGWGGRVAVRAWLLCCWWWCWWLVGREGGVGPLLAREGAGNRRSRWCCCRWRWCSSRQSPVRQGVEMSVHLLPRHCTRCYPRPRGRCCDGRRRAQREEAAGENVGGGRPHGLHCENVSQPGPVCVRYRQSISREWLSLRGETLLKSSFVRERCRRSVEKNSVWPSGAAERAFWETGPSSAGRAMPGGEIILPPRSSFRYLPRG